MLEDTPAFYIEGEKNGVLKNKLITTLEVKK